MKPNIFKNTRNTPNDLVSLSENILSEPNKMSIYGSTEPFTYNDGLIMNPSITGSWYTNYIYVPSIYCNSKKITIEFDYIIMSNYSRFEAGFIKPALSNSVNSLTLEITSLNDRILIYFKTLDSYYILLGHNAHIGETVKFRMVFDNDTFYVEIFINNKWIKSSTIGTILPTTNIGFIPIFGESKVNNLRVYSGYSYESEVRFIGDSNTANTVGLGRMATNYFNSVQVFAGQGDTSLEVKNSIVFINTISKSKTSFIMIGTNDIPIATPFKTFVNNIKTIYDTLRGDKIFLEIPPRNGYGKGDVALYNRELRRVIPDNKLVPVFQMLKNSTGGLNSLYDSGDGVHINSNGINYILNILNNWIV